MSGEGSVDALERLAALIRQGRELGLLPNHWDELAQTAIAERSGDWLLEPDFRQRTGASDKWCRKHYDDCENEGLARKRGRRREWHIHARRPARRNSLEGIEQDILDSHKGV